MTPGSLLVLMRGTATERIREDAERHGLHADEVVIVARAGDQLAQPGDVTPERLIDYVGSLLDAATDNPVVTLVANGGPTLGVRVALLLQRLAHDESLLYCAGAREHMLARDIPSQPALQLRVVDLQRDGLVELV